MERTCIRCKKTYWKNNNSFEAARREFRRHFQLGRHDPAPSAHDQEELFERQRQFKQSTPPCSKVHSVQHGDRRYH
ncbi:hypothetical protein C0J52_20520 [Blattella germanica]|nr:hypothetical protein C0J52_20520 [Blattella germanica]